MSRCKICKKKIRWLEIPTEGDVHWRAFNPRAKRGEPLTPHVCKLDPQKAFISVGGVNIEPAGDGANISDDDLPWWKK